MKNLTSSHFSLVIMAVLTLLLFTYGSKDIFYSVNNSSGAQPGYSGDPANGGKNCTNCHSGPAAQLKDGWITSDIPEDGYLHGFTYTITATAYGVGHSKFGFQISPQNSSGLFLGTLTNTGADTKLTTGNNYITHTASGNTGQDSLSWSFEWTAPEAGTGEVIFYGAFNIANNNGGSSGDTIVLSTLSVNEDASSNIPVNTLKDQFSVFPNPATDHITVETAPGLSGSGYVIYNQAGRKVMAGRLSGSSNRLSIEQLEPGIYHLQIKGTRAHAIKFLKK